MILTKMCIGCLAVKSADDFGMDRRLPSGLKSRCKECQKIYNSRYFKTHKEALSFHNSRYRAENKIALSEKQKAHRKKNILRIKQQVKAKVNTPWYREYHKKQMGQWREKNPERVKAIVKASYHRNKEKHVERGAKSYLKNRNARLVYAKQYRKDKPEKVRFLNAKRRARKLQISGSYTREQWETLLSFFAGVCPMCGFRVSMLSIDHIIPITKPNSSQWITNIQPLCKPCNSRKSAKIIDFRPLWVKEWAESEMKGVQV